MGVIYKLRPEIKDFIVEKKMSEPNLSCRQFTALVFEKFQFKLSKSSINFLFKEAGLSMPVGRRLKKKRRRRPEILLKPPEEIKLIAAPKELPPELLPELPPEPELKVEVPEVPVEPEPRREEGLEAEKIAQEAGLKVEREKWLKLAEEERRAKEIELPAEKESTGIILLKAADYLVGGTYYFMEAIKNQLKSSSPDLLAKTEALLYGSLDMSLYLNELQEVKALPSAIFRIISSVFQEVRGVKVSLSDGSDVYLDGQLHTIWSTPQLPDYFATTIYNIKSYINKYFQEEHPFMLFMAPGDETPSKEFFDFILALQAQEKQIVRLTLYGNKFEEIEVIPLKKDKQRSFVFGLWPWQFGQFRRVKNTIDEFKPFNFEPLKKDFYLAEVEMELLQPTVNKRITLKGCALKTNFKEKIRLVILSNLGLVATQEELAGLYFNHWPNLEESFQDFSRKIELFTYTASSPHCLSLESLAFDRENSSDIKALFDYYLRALDLYLRWHFLPAGYEKKDFPTMNERFYGLKVNLARQKDATVATLKTPPNYSYLKDLEYALRRINEREIVLPDGTKLWCKV